MTTPKWEKVGEAAVDSGQMMLIDPCYIESTWQRRGETKDDAGDMNYEAAGERTMRNARDGAFGGLRNTRSRYDLAFVTRTYLGDGVFPVSVQRAADGRVVAMMIRFDE